MGVQKKVQESLPKFDLVVGKGFEEFGADEELPLHAAGLALTLFPLQRLQTNERLIATSNDDFLSLAGLFNEAREVRLGMMDFYSRHIS